MNRMQTGVYFKLKTNIRLPKIKLSEQSRWSTCKINIVVNDTVLCTQKMS